MVFRWIDKLRKVDGKVSDIAYDLALVDVYALRNNGNVDENSGMIQAEKVYGEDLQVISIHQIKRAAHLIPTGKEGCYYINNYIDLEMYNCVY